MKKLLTILLALCLVGGLTPSLAFAEAGATAEVNSTDTLTNALSDTRKTTIKLTSDITTSTTISVSRNITLDLNGYVLKYDNNNNNNDASATGSVIKVTTDVTLTVVDRNPTVEHKFSVDDNTSNTTYGLWTLNENGSKTVTGGVITGGTGTLNIDLTEGGGIKVEGTGTVNLNGGNIVGCTATRGGGISGGNVNINGGNIIGCVATQFGGGVYVDCQYGCFNMTNGNIKNCCIRVDNNVQFQECGGGAVCVSTPNPSNDYTSRENTMSGGSISYCKSYVMNMGGGNDQYRQADGSAGALLILNSNFKLSGGSVSDISSMNDIFFTDLGDKFNSPTFEFKITGGNVDAKVYEHHHHGNLKTTGGKIKEVEIGCGNFTVAGGDINNLGINYDTTTGLTHKIEGGTITKCSMADKANDVVISGGTFSGEVKNTGTITAGTFNGKVENLGTISGGTFNGAITEKAYSAIYTSNITLGTSATITTASGCNTVTYFTDGKEYVQQAVESNKTTSAPTIVPKKIGYTFGGWYKDGTSFNFTDTTVTSNLSVYATWNECTDHTYDANNICTKCGYKKVTYSGGGGGGSSYTATQKPTVAETENGKVTLSADGRTATITPDEGYEVAKVMVNSQDKGTVTTLTGLKTGDKVEVTFQKSRAALAPAVSAVAKTAVTGLDTMKARSSKTANGNVKVVVSLSDDESAAISALTDLGYTVKYKFYRSTKKASGYKARIEKDTSTYINTSGKSGTRYYYKAQIRVYDSDGTLVAKTKLKSCKYACRKF